MYFTMANTVCLLLRQTPFVGPSNTVYPCPLDALIVSISGTGLLLTLPDIEANEPNRNVLEQGSFAFVPAWTEHRVVNETDEDMRWTILQSGSKPVIVELDGWAGDELKKSRRREQKRKSKKEGWVVVRP